MTTTTKPSAKAALDESNLMELRDYFAGQALAGLIASNDEGAGDRIDEVPGYAYAIADAMLEARDA